jgi:signal transduction histidine kinase/CheY-like chemotaxis protein
MQKPWETVKVKILMGYVFLIGIAVFTVWLIYSEILLYTENKTRISNLNNKVLHFNSVLTNLYQAESLERVYSQTGSPVHYHNYDRLMKVIFLQIDSLSAHTDNPLERVHADSILSLLGKKRKNLLELSVIKRMGSSDDLYERAMSRFILNRDSINSLLNIHKTVTESHDTTYLVQKKKKFLERLIYAFNPEDNPDSMLQIKFNQSVQTDTLISEFNAADTVVHFLNDLIQDIRNENIESEQQHAKKEREALANDRVITLQLRQILSIFEKDMLVNSINELRMLQDRIKLTTGYIVALGLLAFVIILVFLVLILKDISKSRQYRIELEKAKQYSDSLLKSKEQIMLSITHDIKTPLASVIGYARLMVDAEDREQQQYYLENINKSSDHILKLINDLVDLTRLETGKLKMQWVKFNLRVLIDDIFAGFFPIASAKNLDLKLVFNAPDNLEYSSDPVRIKQVLENIIANAIKYTEAGRVIIVVSLDNTDNITDHIRFDVIDTGIGISEEDSKHIFNEFSQVAFNNSQRYDGAGLGLTIAQRLINLLNGNITLQSKPGDGSQFTVILPLERKVLENDATEETTSALKSNPDAIKVLVIDDDEIFLNLTSETLLRAGIQVFACNTPAKAFQVLTQNTIDLIVTDIQMPVMTGTELLAYIQRKTGKYLPVIAITGHDEVKTDDYPGVTISATLRKPFLPDVLLENINNILIRKTNILSGKVKTTDQQPSDENTVYSLDLIKQFAVDDPESIHRILTSFIESSIENKDLFEKYLFERDHRSLAELAHKILAMFRQLQANKVVGPLLEIEGWKNLQQTDEQWLEVGRKALNGMGELMDKICEEQNIFIRS